MASLHLCENEIIAFLAGDLDSASVARVESHVDGCVPCRGWLAASVRGSAPTDSMAFAGRSFADGQKVAGRYQIVRFIGAGGMGELYEAHDEVLAIRVALKTVRQERTDEPFAIERLRRELTLARQVTHPHVSRVYDVGLHHDAGEVISFFTLELLTGETLRALLARVGRLPLEQAQRILEQVAAGLDAVHAVGVLHRDLKSDNIFLRATPRGPEAVLTDFGLARPTHAGGSFGSIPGNPVGTPAYMAPEQVAGDPLGPAADLYSLGVVAFEMVTGELPFSGEAPMAIAAQRLTKPAPDPRSVVADLPLEWSRCIEALLQRSARNRPASGAQAVALLESRPQRWASTPWRVGAVAAAALLVIAGASAAAVMLARRPAAVAGATREARRALAVLPLQNASPTDPDAAWLTVALGQVLSAGLAAAPGLRPLAPERLAQVPGDLALTQTAELTAKELEAVRTALDPALVLTGLVTLEGHGTDRPLRLDLRLYDATVGAKIAEVAERGNELEFVACATRATERLREAAARTDPRGMHGGAPTSDDLASAREQVPRSLGAARAWAEGARALSGFELVVAKARLEEAIELEPSFAPAHAALAQILVALGLREEAVSVAQRAFERSAPLPREQRLTIEALYRSTQRNWPRAIELYRTLWTLFPDDLEHGLQLANAQTLASAPKDALATVERLRQLPEPERLDPRIDLIAARALIQVPDFVASQQAAARAGARAEHLGGRLLAARAKLAEAEALVFLSRRDEALALLQRADEVFRAVGDRAGEAKAKVARGHVLRDRGKVDAALTQYAEAEAIDRALGDELNLATVLGVQAVVHRRKGDPRRALALNEQVLVLFQKHSSKTNVCTTLNNLGRTLEDLGQPEAAEARYEQAIALATELGENGIRARALGSVGLLAADRGDLSRGRKAFEEILSIIRLTGDPSLEAGALDMLAGLLIQQGHLEEANTRALEREKLSDGSKLEDALRRAQLRAQLALAKHDLGQAETLAREVAETWRERNSAGDELDGRELLVDVLIASRNAPAVDQELARIHELAGADDTSRPARVWAELQARSQAELGEARVGWRSWPASSSALMSRRRASTP